MAGQRVAAGRVHLKVAHGAGGISGTAIDGASLGAIAALTGLLIALGAVTWFAADDYCNWMRLDEQGLVGVMHWLYFEWSGRIATGFMMFVTLAWLDLPALHWLSAVSGASLLGIAWLLARLAGAEEVRWGWPVRMFALAALCLGLYPILGQTVFWPTGALVYLVPLVLLLAWIIDTHRLLHGNAAAGAVAGFTMNLLLGNAIELLWPIVLIYVLLMGARKRAVMTRERWRLLALRMGGFMLGAVVLAAAPGNYLRATATPDSFRLDPGYLLAQGRFIAGEVWLNGRAVILLLAAASALALLTRAVAGAWRGPAPSTPDRIGVFELGVLIVGGVASLAPMLMVPAQFAPRNAFYLYVLVLLAATALYTDALRIARTARAEGMLTATLVVAGIVVAVIAFARLAPDLAVAQGLRERLAQRDRMLREASARGETDVVVPTLGLAVPRSQHFVDVFPDPGAWLNLCIARYYRLDSVRAESRTAVP